MDQAENKQNTEDTPDEAAPISSGEQLRLAREARGLSLKDVVATTRQSLDLLAAMEAMETSHIAPTILRMQARSYAEFLGLPGQEIAAGFSETRSAPDSTNMPAERLRSSRVETRRQLWPIGVAAAVIVSGGLAFWGLQSIGGSDPSAPTVSRMVHPVVAKPSPSRAARRATVQELSVRATKTAWIEVRASDGTIFRNRMMSKGEIYYPRMDAGWTVTVRDASAFEWWLADNLVGPMGEDETALYSVSVDDALRRGQEQLSTALAEIASQAQRP